MAETGVVVEIEPETRRVHEDELTRNPDLELPFRLDELATHRRELFERFLHRRVLHRIQLDGAKRGVIGEDQTATGAPHIGVAGAIRGVTSLTGWTRRRRSGRLP